MYCQCHRMNRIKLIRAIRDIRWLLVRMHGKMHDLRLNSRVILSKAKNLWNAFVDVEILLRFAHQDDREGCVNYELWIMNYELWALLLNSLTFNFQPFIGQGTPSPYNSTTFNYLLLTPQMKKRRHNVTSLQCPYKQLFIFTSYFLLSTP